jgi:peptidoglycan/LPS O-acetylase OafA/YrhL
MTIAERFDPRRNSLNFLRLAFATAVIVSHAWPLGGYGNDPVLARQTIGTWAVAGFFAISGYLIASSRTHTTFVEFLVRRVLRIYPGFLACLVVVAVVFAPISTLRGGSYHPTSALSYIGRNLFLKVEQDGISNTLTSVPYGSAWDGSLWTLFYEFVCYLAIGVLIGAPQRWRRPLVTAAFVVTAAGGGYAAHHAMNPTAANFLALSPIFFAGSLLYLYADRIRLDWRVGLACIALLPLATELRAMQYLGAPLAAYACLWLGAALPLSAVGRRNDVSYGVYIYAFPVQQFLVLLHANRGNVGWYVLASVVATFPFAIGSWFLIEKPALGLKRYALAGGNVRRAGAHRLKPTLEALRAPDQAPQSNASAAAGQ